MKRSKANKVVRINATGQIRVITEEMLHQTEFLALMGATNKQLSLFFRVSESTIEYWSRHYPEFEDAKKRGGMVADMNVAKGLYQRATGYNFMEEKVFRVGRKLIKMQVQTHIPPDVKAQMYWLSSRQREQWTQTQKINHSGTIEHKHSKVEELPIHELEPKTQEFLFEIAQKQLTNGDRDN